MSAREKPLPSEESESDGLNGDGTRGGPRSSVLFFELVLVVVTLIFIEMLVGFGTASPTSNAVRQLAWLNNFVLVLQILVLRKSFGSATAPLVMFTVLLSLFTSGQLILFSFGYEPTGADVLNRESYVAVARATAFYLTSFSIYCLACVAVNELMKRRSRASSSKVQPSDWQLGLKSVSLVCLAVGAVPFAVGNFYNIQVVNARGYSGYYADGARLTSPLLALSYLFVTGLVFRACTGARRDRQVALILLALVAGVRFAAGDRGEGMIYLITAYLLWSNLKPGRAHRRLVLAGIVVFAVVSIPMIGAMRQTFGGGSPAAASDQSATQTTLGTMGATLFPLVKITELAPDGVPYTRGGTYASGAAQLLPAIVQGGPIADVADDPLLRSPANWLMVKLGMSYGPGFTPFAESYLNFGWWGGSAMMAAFGAVFTLLLRLPSRRSSDWPIRLAFVAGAFVLLGFSVRGSSNFLVPYFFRYLLVPSFIVALVARRSANQSSRPESSGL